MAAQICRFGAERTLPQLLGGLGACRCQYACCPRCRFFLLGRSLLWRPAAQSCVRRLCWRDAKAAFSRAVRLARRPSCWWVPVQVLIMAGSSRGRPTDT
jgi:hypothetical protein